MDVATGSRRAGGLVLLLLLQLLVQRRIAAIELLRPRGTLDTITR
jgi:hypothetical protein